MSILDNLKEVCKSHLRLTIDSSDVINFDMFDYIDDTQYNCFMEVSDSQSWDELLRTYDGVSMNEFLK